MHYIRFLKPPRITQPRPGHCILTAKITIVNDLGDNFLWCDIPIVATIHDNHGNVVSVQSLQWKCEMRQLEISMPVHQKNISKSQKISMASDFVGITPVAKELGDRRSAELSYRLSVRPSSNDFTPYRLAEVLSINRSQNVEGAVLRSLSATFDSKVNPIPPVIFRGFKLEDGKPTMMIREDTGESIARHIWDAGVILSALLHEMTHPFVDSPKALPVLGTLLNSVSPLSVLELGTGCAIVSTTVAHSIPSARVTATDLPEAAETAKSNLQQVGNASYVDLDWSEPLPAVVASERFDLVLVADCTYNPDVVPHLVATLAALIKITPEVLICLAMKVRHESEAVFFDLMKEKGIVQVDKHSERLGNLDGEDESVDVYLFKGAGATKVTEST